MTTDTKEQFGLDALARGLQSRPDELEDDHAERIVGEVSEFYRRIRRSDEELDRPYRAGGEWEVYVDMRASVYDSAVAGDVGALAPLLREFWRNDLGPIVSQYAYYADLVGGNEAKIERFTHMLSRDYASWCALWSEDPSVLEVPRIGNPWGLELDGTLVTPLALRFHTHAKQIVELLHDTEGAVVAEIGGGYGGMAHRLAQLDPGVTYVDFDLPETLMVAAFYLRAAMPDRDIVLWNPAIPLDRESLQAHDVVLAPHYALAELGRASVDLFLNAFSLSEMRMETIEEYMRRIAFGGRRYFLQNNVDRPGVVNRGYERVPCSRFPLDSSIFKRLYHRFDTFQGSSGDYRESLHERVKA